MNKDKIKGKIKDRINEIIKEVVAIYKYDQQLKYLNQSIDIEEVTNLSAVRAVLISIMTAFFAFLLWAGFSNIDEVSVAKGEIVPYGFVQIVQHMEGGIVTGILVREGDVVNEGDILLKLNDGSSNENLAEYRIKNNNLIIKAERLSAFIESRSLDFSNIPDISESEKVHQLLAFDNMIKAKEEERNIIKEQINQKEKEINTFNARISTIDKNLKLANEVYEMHNKLTEKGYTSKLAFINAEKEKNQLLGELEETKVKIDQAANSILEYKNKLASLDAKYMDKVYSELDDVKGSIAENKEVIRKLENRVDRLSVRSPVHGLVKGLSVNTIGGVISPGDTLMEIVPLDKSLVAEVRIMPRDIGHVQVGQNVVVKISSFDFSRYGSILGHLEFVSAATFIDKGKENPYYMGRVVLTKNYVGSNQNENLLVPGMLVEASIVTGKKTILDYLLKPIHLSLKMAMQER